MKNMCLLVRNDRGSAGMKAAVAIAIVGAAVFAGIQLVPLFWGHWSFEADVKTAVRFAFDNHRQDTQKNLRKEIIGLINRIDAEYEDKDVKVTVEQAKKKILVEIWYSRAHSLPFYENPKQFYIRIENTPL